MFTAVMSRMTISWAISRTNSSRPLFSLVAASGRWPPWRWRGRGPWVLFGVSVADLLRCSISCSSLSWTVVSGLLKQTLVSDVKRTFRRSTSRSLEEWVPRLHDHVLSWPASSMENPDPCSAVGLTNFSCIGTVRNSRKAASASSSCSSFPSSRGPAARRTASGRSSSSDSSGRLRATRAASLNERPVDQVTPESAEGVHGKSLSRRSTGVTTVAPTLCRCHPAATDRRRCG